MTLALEVVPGHERLAHLVGEPLLGIFHPRVAHRLVLGGIGADLGAVQGDVAERDQPRRLAELEHLGEQARERVEMPLPKLGDAVVVGMLVPARTRTAMSSYVARSIFRAETRLCSRRTRGNFTIIAG